MSPIVSPCCVQVQIPSIKEFLKGKSIMISGATGFLAKASLGPQLPLFNGWCAFTELGCQQLWEA